MPQRIIKFRINQDGLVEESVEGIQGESCHELTKNLEDALGVIQSTVPTQDAFTRPENNSQSISAEQFL